MRTAPMAIADEDPPAQDQLVPKVYIARVFRQSGTATDVRPSISTAPGLQEQRGMCDVGGVGWNR